MDRTGRLSSSRTTTCICVGRLKVDPEIPEGALCPYGKIAAHSRPFALRSPVQAVLSGNEREFSARTGATMIRETR